MVVAVSYCGLHSSLAVRGNWSALMVKWTELNILEENQLEAEKDLRPGPEKDAREAQNL